jgi:hypothetical protein
LMKSLHQVCDGFELGMHSQRVDENDSETRLYILSSL